MSGKRKCLQLPAAHAYDSPPADLNNGMTSGSERARVSEAGSEWVQLLHPNASKTKSQSPAHPLCTSIAIPKWGIRMARQVLVAILTESHPADFDRHLRSQDSKSLRTLRGWLRRDPIGPHNSKLRHLSLSPSSDRNNTVLLTVLAYVVQQLLPVVLLVAILQVADQVGHSADATHWNSEVCLHLL